ncbi:MAG TPA: hypothetical protein VIC33_07520 [Vicinamibacterales bacterium]
MLARALGVWLLLLLAAIVNGGLRETFVIPRTGDAAGHAISTITLCAAILVLAWLTVEWMAPATARDAWRIGAMWVALTVAFDMPLLIATDDGGTRWLQVAGYERMPQHLCGLAAVG